MARSDQRKPLYGAATTASGDPFSALAEFARARGVPGRFRDVRGATAAGFAAGHYVTEQPGLLVVIAGDPRWDDALPTDAAGPGDPAERVAAEYCASGERCIGRIRGSFALAILDLSAAITFLAVDRVGIERLAYAVTGETIVFGSRADVVAATPGVQARLRQQALFDFLLMHMVPSPDTVYDGVSKLKPGTYARFHRGQVSVHPHWTPSFIESARTDERTLAERLLRTLELSVAEAEPDTQSGAFLSGGLDSSTVAGMLSRVRGRGVKTFSIGFGTQGYDELDYARLASAQFGTESHEYNVTPTDVVDAIPRIAAAYDEPFGNSSAVPTYFCARLARENGVTHLLAGDGGDELFGGNERYARQLVFEAYRHVPATVRRNFIEPVASLISPDSRVLPLRKLRSYIDQARIPLPERLETWNFMYRADLSKMLEPEFRAAVDSRYPFARMAETYGSVSANAVVNRMLYYDWQYTLADNDLRKVGTMCDLAGVAVSFPMLSDRLIDLSLEVTPRQKVCGTELRAFYKRALTGFLPDRIIHKEKHGFGLPFGVWLKTHRPLADLIYSLLTGLKSRGLIRPAFLDQLIADHRTGHASFFGYAIWDLAMLEAWLTAHP